MSMKLTAQAMDMRVGNPLRKLVLLKLCDNANDKCECWPSLQYLADQCEITTRSVLTHIAALENDGFLRVIQRTSAGKKISNFYIITLGNARLKTVVSSESVSHLSSENNSLLNPVSSETGSRSSESPSHLSSESPSHKPVIQPVIEPVNKKIYKKISFSELPGGISERAAREFVDHRERIKKPLTQGAFDRSMIESLRAGQIGLSPDRAIAECIDAGWRCVRISWLRNRLFGSPPPIPMHGVPSGRSTRDVSIAEDLSNRDWAR